MRLGKRCTSYSPGMISHHPDDRPAAAHVLRAAAHGAKAFGVDLAPTVHVYLGPVDDDPEGATLPPPAAGNDVKAPCIVLNYFNNAGE